MICKSALSDVVSSVVAGRIFGVEALIFTILNLNVRLGCSDTLITVSVYCMTMRQGAVVCGCMQFLRNLVYSSFLSFP